MHTKKMSCFANYLPKLNVENKSYCFLKTNSDDLCNKCNCSITDRFPTVSRYMPPTYSVNGRFNHTTRFSRYSRQKRLNELKKTIPFNPKSVYYMARQANLVLIAYASSEGSGEPAHPRSLARTFTARSYKQ